MNKYLLLFVLYYFILNINILLFYSNYIEQDLEPPSYSSHLRKLNTESLNLNQSLVNSSLLDSSLITSSLLNSSSYTTPSVSKSHNASFLLNDSGLTGSTKLSGRPGISSAGLKYLPETDLSDIQSSYLDQSEILKHLISKDKKSGYSDDQSVSSSNSGINLLADSVNNSSTVEISEQKKVLNSNKEKDFSILNLPPPPSYSRWQREQSSESSNDPLILDSSMRPLDKTCLSRSQPDLSRLSSASKDLTSPKDLVNLK